MNAIATIAQMVREAESHADSLAKDRLRAIGRGLASGR